MEWWADGLRVKILVLYPFSGGLLISGPLDWRLLIVGVLFLFGGPVAFGLLLQREPRSVWGGIVAVLIGGVIAYILTFAFRAFFFRQANFFRDFLILAILYSALVITFIQVTTGGIHRRPERARLAAGVIIVILPLLILASRVGAETEKLSAGFWISIALFPIASWIGALVIPAFVEYLGRLINRG